MALAVQSVAPEHDPLAIFDHARFLPVPDIIEFTTSHDWLNRPSLYPRQATLLKIIFLQDYLFTPYDHQVIEEWSQGFSLNEAKKVEGDDEDSVTITYDGDWGIVPDVYERIDYLKSIGRRWFGVVLAVQGRRSGKGHIGGISGAYVLWNYIALPDPRGLFGVAADKRMASQVFAGKKAQARDNQWRDIANVVSGAPCFQPYLGTILTDNFTVNDRRALVRRTAPTRGPVVASTLDDAAFQVAAREATTMAGRGPASFMQFYDEGAHMVATGISRSMGEVWETATPSLDQFKPWDFIYSGSSPWTMDGKFYDLVQQTLQVEADSREAVYPEHLVIQLESWDIYKDWELTKTGDFVLAPAYSRAPDSITVIDDEIIEVAESDDEGEPVLVHHEPIYATPLRKAIQVYDRAARRKERANPHTFAVEYRAKWATGLDTYFPEHHVKRMFDMGLEHKRSGSPTEFYVMHGDPGRTGSNFGFAVAHKEPSADGSPIPTVVFDFVHGWQPFDFPGGEMDYIAIEEEIGELMDGFLPAVVTMDQWNSLSMLQRLAARSRKTFKPAQVYERTATAPINWRTAETTKVALALNKVRAPYNELAELEFRFLRKLPGDKVDHPDTGPCTTKDVYDAMSICIVHLIGQDVAAAYGEAFTALRMEAGLPGGMPIDSAPMSEVSSAYGQVGGMGSPNDAFAQLTRDRMSRQQQYPTRGRR